MKKWALIIGGSSGIGLASAKKLGRSGFNLLIIHRDRRSTLEPFEKEVEQMQNAGIAVHTFNIDATNAEKITECSKQISEYLQAEKIQLILHSVSRGNLKPLHAENSPQLTDQDLLLTIEAMGINVISWTRSLMEKKIVTSGARLITLTSAGSSRYWKGYAAIAMAKSVLESATRYLAVELAPHDIRVNAIHAGITDTPSLKMIPGYEQLKTTAEARNPSGRLTTAEDVADVVYLLSLPEAHWINGTIIHVDGGEHVIG